MLAEVARLQGAVADAVVAELAAPRVRVEAALAEASWRNAFYGFVPGSMGETSAFACLLGAGLLIWTGIGSWRTMAGVLGGTVVVAGRLNVVGSDTNPMFQVPWYWHAVLGGWAFGMVFMATDPVSSAFTNQGKLIYGALIGVLVVLIRVVIADGFERLDRHRTCCCEQLHG